MKRASGWWALVLAALAGCSGVPRAAGTLARSEAAAIVVPAGDAEVRAALLQQADAWQQLSGFLGQRESGGITGVDARFVELVNRAAALAARQRALIEQGVDDPAQNRATLESFRALWQQSNRYLNP